MDPQGSERRLAAIVFSDIVGYTAVLGELGDQRFRDSIRLSLAHS